MSEGEQSSSGSEGQASDARQAAAWAVPPALAPVELLWRKWLALAAIPLAGVVVVAGAWAVFSAGSDSGKQAEQSTGRAEKPAPATEQPTPRKDGREAAPVPLDARWVPQGTRLFVTFEMSRLAGREELGQAISLTEPVWQTVVGRMFDGLGLQKEMIRRLSWASSELPVGSDPGVMVVELNEGQDASRLRAAGEEIGIELAGRPCRRLTQGGWSHPFAVLDERTIVTGREDLLRELAGQGELSVDRGEGQTSPPSQPPIKRLLGAHDSNADFVILLDLAPHTRAGWHLPNRLVDNWPGNPDAWHALRDMPVGVGVWLRCGDRIVTEIGLACEGQTAADTVHAALGELIPAAKSALEAERERLTEKLLEGRIAAEAAGPYEALLKHSTAALGSARSELADQMVWVRIEWGEDLSELAAALSDRRAVIRKEWFAQSETAARPAGDEPATGLADRQGESRPVPGAAGEEKPEPAEESEEGPGRGREPAAKAEPQLAEADVEAHLAERMVQISLPGIPLVDAVDLLAQLSGLRISFDLEAIAEPGATVRDPVTIESSDVTAGELLESILSRRGLAYELQDGQIVVTAPGEKRSLLIPVSYAVSDLAGSERAALDRLANLIEQLVVPESWERGGGRGSILAHQGTLTITQTDAVHQHVLAFCEKLRAARGIPLQSRRDPREFTLRTRRDVALAKLSQRVTANFREPAPLMRILADVEDVTKTEILIDWLALGAGGLSPEVEGSVNAKDQPFSDVLEELLRPLGLAFRVVDADTLEVTTQDAASARLELEFYAVGELVAGGETAARLARRIKDQVGGGTWSDTGGPGVLYFDEPSGCLIVLQSQPIQFELESLLDEWALERKANRPPANREPASRG